MGRSAFGGAMCGPVFQEFMTEATAKYGGGQFAIPPGGTFIKIDRFTGARLPNEASGANVVAEYFRDGEEPIFGLTFDGGFAMGSNLPLFQEVLESGRQVTTSSGETATVGPKADFGTVSSGGLY
jgi:penicillin-binding protein 1A